VNQFSSVSDTGYESGDTAELEQDFTEKGVYEKDETEIDFKQIRQSKIESFVARFNDSEETVL